ncbi:MAG: hypothetical protein V1779_04310 [bacterium]
MVKSIITWIIALFISMLVVWMFWSLIVPGEEPFFNALFRDSTVLIMFSFIIFVVAIPVYMIVRKKLIK